MGKGCFLSGCLLAASFAAAPAGAQTVVVTDAAELVAAIEDEAGNIEVEGVITLGPYQSTGKALPAIGEADNIRGFSEFVSIRGRDGAELRAAGSGFRLAEVLDSGSLALRDIKITGFDSSGPGGALLVVDGRLRLERVVLEGNRSDRNGGAILGRGRDLPGRGPDVEMTVIESSFQGNTSALRGGAVHLHQADGQVKFERTQFVDNAAAFGCAVSLRRSEDVSFNGNVFRGGCDQALVDALVDATLGQQGFDFFRNTWVASSGLAYRFRLGEQDAPRPSRMGGNLLVALGDDPVCQGDVSGNPENARIQSLGTNVATDASCDLSKDTDQIVADASQLVALSGLPLPLEGGPALDAEALDTAATSPNEARCGLADARGLGRPQDGDGDGVPECDRGAIEKRGVGPDVGPAHSGAYFDPARPGEGYFVEVLPDGEASVTMLTYAAVGGSPPRTKKQPSWIFGRGHVVGNSIVAPDLDEYTALELFVPGSSATPGDFSFVFSDCRSGSDNPGTAYLRSAELGRSDLVPHSDLFTRLVRLSSVVPCSGSAHPKAGLSGSFSFGQSGERVLVQWMPDGRVLVAWHILVPDRDPLWLISDSATVDGNTITASMIHPAQSTAFGPDFDHSEISLEPAGTLTIEYTGCDTIEFDFESEVEGFESSSFTGERLTQPAETTCDL